MKNFKKGKSDSKTWGVLGKQETFYAPTHFMGEKVPLNASPLDSWDYKKSRYRRVDLVPKNDGQQAGTVIGQTTPVTPTPSATPVTPTPTPTSTSTPTPTPSITPTSTSAPIPSPTPTSTSTSTPTPTPSGTPLAPGTSEAYTYLNAVVSAGGSVNSTQSAATITMFNSLFSNSIWDSLTAFYPVLGGVEASHAINAKNPGTNNLTFSGGWTHSSTGMNGNGSTGYANTGISDSFSNQRHISIYSRTNSISSCVDIGCIAPSTYGTYLQLRFTDFVSTVGTKAVVGLDPSGAKNYANTDSTGFYIATSPSNKQIYQNGTLKVNVSNTAGNANVPIYIGAYNNNGTANAFSSRQYCFASIGGDISSVASTFSSIVNTYQTSLGRNTY